MKVTFKSLILGLAVLYAGTVSAQHVHRPSVQNTIEGQKNPELISEVIAYRVTFLHLSVPSNFSSTDKAVQLSHVGLVRLPLSDLQPFLAVMAEFRSRNESIEAKWSKESEAAGAKFNATPFIQEQDDLIRITRDQLARSLSAIGLLHLQSFVESNKRNITVHTGGAQ